MHRAQDIWVVWHVTLRDHEKPEKYARSYGAEEIQPHYEKVHSPQRDQIIESWQRRQLHPCKKKELKALQK